MFWNAAKIGKIEREKSKISIKKRVTKISIKKSIKE